MMISSVAEYEEYLKNYLLNTSKLALLLDYDGTLTPIVAHPDLAIIPDETKCILKSLTTVPEIFVGIISGRGVTNVKQMVGLDNVTYAGNHGFEVLYPDGSTYNHNLPDNFNDQVKQLISKLEANVVKDGAWIENKSATLTFHFRAVPQNLQADIEQKAQAIIEEANFKVGKSHCALEARPKIDWNKGKVALMLLEKQYGCQWNKDVKVVFAGDDTTDEDAMLALKGHAATFRIGLPEVVTHAEKKIQSTKDVVNILRIIANLFKK